MQEVFEGLKKICDVLAKNLRRRIIPAGLLSFWQPGQQRMNTFPAHPIPRPARRRSRDAPASRGPGHSPRRESRGQRPLAHPAQGRCTPRRGGVQQPALPSIGFFAVFFRNLLTFRVFHLQCILCMDSSLTVRYLLTELPDHSRQTCI